MSAKDQTPRPDKERLLAKLRGFQKRTVAHVVRRLFDPEGSSRFLVADEVGLGKTLIARGVISEIVDRRWDSVKRLDVLYVCSNSALARENLRKLHIGGTSLEGTRLTLLPKQLPHFDSKLNFVSFTPGTALQISGYGRVDERVVLYALLRQEHGDPAWLKNLLQGDVEHNRWRNGYLSYLPEVADDWSKKFHRRLKKDRDIQKSLRWASETLVRADARLDDEQRSRRYKTVGTLRKLLARTCIDALQPDIIILDEFQRFKDLLSTGDDETAQTELSELARELFDYRTPEGNRVATLLLSATPYRWFATTDESFEGEPYDDFLDTMKFLIDDDARFLLLKGAIARYRQALLGATVGSSESVTAARDELQRLLKRVMVRMERIDSTDARDAMIEEPIIRAPLHRKDLQHYMATEALADEIGGGDVVEYWKSAPYLFNFMKTYQLKEMFKEKLHLKGVRDCFERVGGEFLRVDQIHNYEAIDPANARLRSLAEHALGKKQWSMLWLPPTLPYWPLDDAWKDNEGFSKKLVFSSWNVVPDVVSALLSYEAERGMMGESPDVGYAELYRRQRPLLRYLVRDDKPANMTTLALAIPCFALADGVSPLALAVEGKPVLVSVAAMARELVEKLKADFPSEGPQDPRWHWAAPLLLDRGDPTLRTLLEEWINEGHEDEDGETEDSSVRGSEALLAHRKEALKLLDGELKLGAVPDSLADTLALLALGSPANVVARALRRPDVSPIARRKAAVQVAGGFRTLFNQPQIIRMLRGAVDDGDESYWETTLSYAVKGNLQAVIDEQVHLLWEQYAWDDKAADALCESVARALTDSVTMKVSRIQPDIYSPGARRIEAMDAGDAGGTRERVSMRTSFALRYGTVKGDSGTTEAREESVRTAFKSPFFPFVLVSTSVGQEGLDFHPWCHDIWHWNLPGNPVDLEQREGRVHRYKGLAIRKNVAQDAMAVLKQHWDRESDPWDVLFNVAEQRHGGAHELVPHWIAPGPHKIRRCVPTVPFSSEVEQLRRLKRSLAIYRVVFGQPRQEELLQLLENSELTREQLEQWTVSLRADAE